MEPLITTSNEITFDDLGLHPTILKGIHNMGFTRPTPIQAQAIPPIMEGRDVVGLAQTGTGKTAAFVLPTLHRLLQGPKGKHPRALILAPTRELAQQSIDHMKGLSRFVHLTGTAIYGGVPMNPQITTLRTGVDVISATPGRLLDHVYSGRINFVALEIFIMDEVDRMLDMGFMPDIQKVLSVLPPKRQNLVFSATLPPEIQSLVHKILANPVTIQIGQRSAPAVGIRHAVYPVPRHLKTDLLAEILRGADLTSVIVFTRTKHMAERLSQTLDRKGFKVSVLHGDRSQSQRMQALERFRAGRSQVMVATDIAARGIDIDAISHVINFDIPGSPEDYIHRIGRTARADATGDAFSLVSSEEEFMVRAIEKELKKVLPRVTLPNFDYKKAGPPKPAGSGHHGHSSSHGRYNQCPNSFNRHR